MNSALGAYVLRFERNPENVATAVLCHILRSSEDARQLLIRWMNRTGAEPLPDNLDFIDQLEQKDDLGHSRLDILGLEPHGIRASTDCVRHR